MIWSIPVVAVASTLASWLAVRVLAAPPPTAAAVSTAKLTEVLATNSDDTEIGDPSLRALIGRFAESARAQRDSQR